ncbi:mRNA surveillance protein pelota [Candidatus Woesearchaeota archaeon]|nr:mRNA surveillance protein pelota [Candidatus Woesearchaeota archaeon]
MKILQNDAKKGIMKLMPQSNDDLWLLSQVINPGAFVSSKTTRKVKLSETKVEKKTYYVTIKAEKAAFENEILRVSGIVESEHDDIPKGSSHSLSVSINDDVKIEQGWLRYQIDKISEATKEQAKVLLVVMDREDVYFAKLVNEGYKLLSNFEGNVQKKVEGMAVEGKGNFYSDIAKKLKEYDGREKIDSIVVASPAFFKEDFMNQLNDDILKRKIILATVSSVGENAFNELLKRDEVKQALQNQRFKIEMEEVENLFSEIGKDGKCTYGYDHIIEKANEGNILKLLVSTHLIQQYKENEDFLKLEDLFKLVDSIKGEIVIISSSNEAGKKLDGIAGIGALLRY